MERSSEEMDANQQGCGMSRAAKKRAKKKQKKRKQQQQQLVPSKLPKIQEGHIKEPPQKPKHPVEDRTILDNSGNSSDEEVAMKVPAAAPPPTVAELPAGCTTLKEILLLNDDDTTPETTTASAFFRQMTSRQRAHCALEFLLQPACISVAHFYDTYWEKKPLLVGNNNDATQQHRHRLDGFLSFRQIRSILKNNETLYYGKDLNVTRYNNGRRVTLDKVVVAAAAETNNHDEDTTTTTTMTQASSSSSSFVAVKPKELWRDYFDAGGCTVRLLCPHQHSTRIHALLSLLELEWGCRVGANAYLTPTGGGGHQGFAPHYDDIEAFVLQLQGQKRWKVYAPLNAAQRLPRTSSKDYVPADLKHVEPVLDVVLEAG